MNTLIAVGTGAAFLFSAAVTLFDDWFAARGVEPHVYYETVAWIIALVLLGNLLEARAKGRTSGAIRRLIGLRPATARVLRGGHEEDIPLAALRAGDEVARPPRRDDSRRRRRGRRGEQRRRVDAHRRADTDHQASGRHGHRRHAQPERRAPRPRRAGGRRHGAVADHPPGPAGAGQQGARSSGWPTAISAVFVPVVLSIAIVTFVVWFDVGPAPAYLHALVSAVTVLIIACPCAMGLAVPTAVMVSTGRGAELGVLIKGGEALERSQAIDTVVFDKTGTITEGHPAVQRIVLAPGVDRGAVPDEARLVELAAAVEALSEHPLAEAIVAESRPARRGDAPGDRVREPHRPRRPRHGRGSSGRRGQYRAAARARHRPGATGGGGGRDRRGWAHAGSRGGGRAARGIHRRRRSRSSRRAGSRSRRFARWVSRR